LKYKFKDNCPKNIEEIYEITFKELNDRGIINQPILSQKVVLRFFEQHPDLLITALN